MSATSQQLRDFCQFAEARLRAGSCQQSLDDLYGELRAFNPTKEELNAGVLAVRAALRDLEGGELGRPINEFATAFRMQNEELPMASNLKNFVHLVSKSGLLSEQSLRDACLEFHTDKTDEESVEEFCRSLVAKSLLTEWQCGKLRMGKWKGFFLDGYCLLGHISKDMTTSTYLCKEVETGKRVAMAVIPPAIDTTNDGKIHYTIREINEESS